MCWVDSEVRWAGVGLQNVDEAEKRLYFKLTVFDQAMKVRVLPGSAICAYTDKQTHQSENIISASLHSVHFFLVVDS